jgi:hypothetical protein
MNILKKEYWFIWLLLLLFSGGTHIFALASLFDLYDKNAWYAKGKNWLIGLCLFIFPVFIMMTVFMVQMLVGVAYKLGVKGNEIYASPYVWLIMLIIPIFGWIMLTVLLLYLNIEILIKLYEGKGEVK